MSAAGRPLLAARGSSGDIPDQERRLTPPGPGRPPGSSRQKRVLIESACQACRKRKSKCDGQRPNCSRCASLRSECVYEAEEGESRWSALKRRSQVLENQIEDQRHAVSGLLDALQNLPDQDLMAMVRQIRTTPREVLIRDLRFESLPPAQPPMPTPFAPSEQRLPSISTFFNASPPNSQATLLTQQSSMGIDGEPSTSLHETAHALSRPPLDTLEPSGQPRFNNPIVPPVLNPNTEESTGFAFTTPVPRPEASPSPRVPEEVGDPQSREDPGHADPYRYVSFPGRPRGR